MKKFLCVFLSLFVTFLIGCTTSDNHVIEIDSQEGEQLFNKQLEDFQYVRDLEDFLSYNILSITENQPFTSDFSISAKFDKNSSIQGGIDFSQSKVSKEHNLENSDVKFNIVTEKTGDNSEPFEASGTVSLLYQDNELYAKLHSLGVFMGEGNMTAKMYTLLCDLLIDNRVNLEVNSGGIVSVDVDEDNKFPYIIGTIKNVLKAENIQESPDFLGSVVELFDIINSHIDLGISMNELRFVNGEISYFELSDKSIQKEFIGSFQGKDSSFDLSFVASKNGLEVRIYNIMEYDENVEDYNGIGGEFIFSIKENKKSDYSVVFQSIKSQQKIVDLRGEIKYTDVVDFAANFVLEPIEFTASEQKVSGKLHGNIIKKSGDSGKEIPELTGDIILLSEILSSL